MDSNRLESDGSCTKRVLVEKIKSLGEPVYLVPLCENAINLVYFVADIFRRSGHYVNTIINNYEPMGMMILILPFQNMVEDIQITRENTLEDLMNDVNNDSVYKIIRACGTSISLACSNTPSVSNNALEVDSLMSMILIFSPPLFKLIISFFNELFIVTLLLKLSSTIFKFVSGSTSNCNSFNVQCLAWS